MAAIALISASEQTHCALVVCDSEAVTMLFSCCRRCWCYVRETAAVSTQVLCAPCNHAPIYSVILFETIIRCRVHVCLATCRLHLWQNDLDLLRAIAVTRGLCSQYESCAAQGDKLLISSLYKHCFTSCCKKPIAR